MVHGTAANWQPTPRQVEPVLQVANAITTGDDWLIVTHERPDGDAVGSALAVASLLTALGKGWRVLVEEPLPIRFSFLPGHGAVSLVQAMPDRQFTQVIAVDCADVHRYEYAAGYIEKSPVLINIDHHQTNPGYGTVALVDPLAAATCELVYHVTRALGVKLDENLSMCLYTGILTDTGGFSLPNTTREVHQIAAELLAGGVRPYDVAEPALESRTWEQMRLLQVALSHLVLSQNGRYATMFVTREMLNATGCTDDDAEGLVGFARSIDTVEVGMLFRETLDHRVKISLRSKRNVDVALIAQVFAGGGHMRAAGCTVAGSLPEVMKRVIEQVELVMPEA
ncbi:bifunctional oligoribonuclease/PAP phosphatase NrnA [Alicyclobacillaceae bacterium I2511]|nr:bifunctional oligoribonuclease/PAP phosphatase NrnA [Alicyclobacillaceae bacterium I2511]